MILRVIAFGVLTLCLVGGGAVASPDRADAKLLKGTTGQGYPIKVMVKDQAFKFQAFKIELRCQDKRRLTRIQRGFPWTTVGNRGKFRETWSRDGDRVSFRGRLYKRRISGQLRVTDRLGDGTRCASGWTEFTGVPG